MPWRKQTLTPYRSSSQRASNSDGTSDVDRDSSRGSVSKLFGGSEFELDRILIEPVHGVSSGVAGRIELPSNDKAEPVLTKSQIDRHLGHAFLSVAQATDIKMPWEKGMFAKIFGDDESLPQFSVPCPHLQSVECGAVGAAQTLADLASGVQSSFDTIFPRAISCLSDKDFHDKQVDLKCKACDKWLAILALNLEDSEVGRNLAGLGSFENHRQEVREVISAVIGVRSFNTAISRANSVLKFLNFVLKDWPTIKSPFQEQLVWQYFQFLQREGGATTAATTLSAFRYCKHIMGFDNLDVNSRRLKGYSEVLYSKKRKLQQALILSVRQVKCLHSMLEDCDADPFDRAAAGFMLTAIYGRCRASDLSFIESIKHDHNSTEGFVELFTSVHKTGRSAAKKATLLPILAPAVGVTGNNWVALALQVFEESGLKFNGEIAGPLLRPPSHQGPFLCKRGVTSTEIGRLLRGLVGENIDVLSSTEPHISAHSLKATGLAWAARFGMSWPDRAILGRHQSHTNETVAVYSRDLAVGPVSRFAGVVSAIFRGQFCPDAERSQFFPFPPEPPAVAVSQTQMQTDEIGVALEQAQETSCKMENNPSEFSDLIVIDSESDSSESVSSGSGEDTSSSDESEPPAKKRAPVRRVPMAKAGSWVTHRKSGLLHFCWPDPSGSDESKRITACGRTVSSNFSAMTSETDGNIICAICQRRQ